MKRRCNPFSPARRRGATLIEVLAGLVLLGTILSSALVARGRFLRQWHDADQKLAAIEPSEQLITQWLNLSPGTAPVPGEGVLGQSEDLRWRTTWLRAAAAQRLGARVALLEVFDRRSPRRPLLRLEFLLRLEPPATVPATAPAQGSRER